MIRWASFSTASKIRLARALYRGLTVLRAIANRPSVVVTRRRAVVFELDLAEGIDLAMYLGGAFEFNTYRALRRLVRDGDTVLDIGANSGVHTLPLARMVGDAGRVIAFEPTDLAFRRLLRNLELNRDISARVTPVMAYLDDGRRGGGSPPLAFYASWRLEAASGQHPKHFGSLQEAGHAAVWTLDDYRTANNMGRVAVIKLDVDGYECRVLQGAAGLLERDHPAMVVEVCPYALEEHGDSAEEMLGMLSGHGYSFYDERTLRQITSDPKQLIASIKSNSSINVVALPDSVAAAKPAPGPGARP